MLIGALEYVISRVLMIKKQFLCNKIAVEIYLVHIIRQEWMRVNCMIQNIVSFIFFPFYRIEYCVHLSLLGQVNI